MTTTESYPDETAMVLRVLRNPGGHVTTTESYPDSDFVKFLRSLAEFGWVSESAADLLRDAANRIERASANARWGQRVVDASGHEAVVRGWDRNGSYLFLEMPTSSVPIVSPARDWSPA